MVFATMNIILTAMLNQHALKCMCREICLPANFPLRVSASENSRIAFFYR